MMMFCLVKTDSKVHIWIYSIYCYRKYVFVFFVYAIFVNCKFIAFVLKYTPISRVNIMKKMTEDFGTKFVTKYSDFENVLDP